MAWGILYICAALIGFVLSLYAVKRKDILGFRYFAAFAFFQSIWSLGYGLEILLPSYSAKVLVAKIEYLPIVATPILWLVFALSYTKFDKWISRKRFLLLSIIPAITLSLVTTNELHGLIWSKLELFDASSGIQMIDFSYGAWFWVQMSYSYALFAISLVQLSISLFLNSEHQKKPILFLICVSLIPFFVNAVYIFDADLLFDLTPLGYFISIVLIIWGLFFNKLYGLKSTVQDTVIELMQDAVIVIDDNETILDLNQPAIEMFRSLNLNSELVSKQAKLYGQHIDTVFPISSQLISLDAEVVSSEDLPFQSEHGANEFAKIHVQLQNKIEYQLKEQLSKTDSGIEVLKQLPGKIERVDDQAYSVELARANKHFNIRVSNFSTASRQRGRVLVVQDVSTQKEQDKLIEEMIFFDKLTNLYNRYSFMQYGKLLLQEDVPISLLILDLDRFKDVNDSLGHSLADDLLIQVARRLSNVVAESDTLARLGADEFAILTSGNNITQAKSLAEDILKIFRNPFSLQGQVVHMHASIGIVTSDYDDSNQKDTSENKIGDLIRHADIAMYEAKHQGLGFSVYSSNKTVTTLRKLNLETDLVQAIENSEFKLFYQPIVQAHNSSLVGFEALLRWKKDDKYVGPAQFISFAEEVGKMKLIDYWVLERVMTHDKALLPNGFVALNLSGTTLRDTGLVQHAKNLIAQGFSPEGIVLEVTESAMINISIATSVLEELKSLGFQVAIDDFGTGYSSLSYIEQFPLDILKIDKSFISSIGKSTVSEALLRTIINLGQNLGVVVLAEGIESPEQQQWLSEKDCLYLQGHLFGWPQPAEYYKDGFVLLDKPMPAFTQQVDKHPISGLHQ